MKRFALISNIISFVLALIAVFSIILSASDSSVVAIIVSFCLIYLGLSLLINFALFTNIWFIRFTAFQFAKNQMKSDDRMIAYFLEQHILELGK